ncbi:hypothetical protein FKM82_013777 [Ascaphus truei]
MLERLFAPGQLCDVKVVVLFIGPTQDIFMNDAAYKLALCYNSLLEMYLMEISEKFSLKFLKMNPISQFGPLQRTTVYARRLATVTRTCLWNALCWTVAAVDEGVWSTLHWTVVRAEWGLWRALVWLTNTAAGCLWSGSAVRWLLLFFHAVQSVATVAWLLLPEIFLGAASLAWLGTQRVGRMALLFGWLLLLSAVSTGLQLVVWGLTRATLIWWTLLGKLIGGSIHCLRVLLNRILVGESLILLSSI